MLILALETSGFGGSIALLSGAEVLGERTLDAQRRHAQTLIPEIQALLRDHGRRAADCELIAVSTGPGSFTGLRVGITCAKTLAYATGAAIAAVPTFPCLAAGCPDDVAQVQVIMNAQRQEFFVGRFQKTAESTWIETQPLTIERVVEWQSRLQSDDSVTGPGVEAIANTVAQQCRVVPAEFWHPQARWVGRLAFQMQRANQLTTCWDLQPLYVRKSAAEEKWDATHGVV
jgi:tRNA threonylcarbamoyladenosine biosynthesis protein TsaB